MCRNTAFQTAASTCLNQKCTAAEVAQAHELQQAGCAGLSSTSVSSSSTSSAHSSVSTISGAHSSVSSSVSKSSGASSTARTNSTASSTTRAPSSSASSSASAVEQNLQVLGILGPLLAGILALML
ncbi:hypothetical protein L208DRAFT_64135 [Tricholoma matsutake]|nr:hypothetical protein L208DRAFT_64135 [Tricholoma matsutake 945]